VQVRFLSWAPKEPEAEFTPKDAFGFFMPANFPGNIHKAASGSDY
jgi:hypothetical protein